MSLTLFFIVLSVGIGYMLYDTFKKSRMTAARPSEPINSKLKVNYAKDCSILNSLQKEKKQSYKTRTISINLNFNTQKQQLPLEQILEVKKIFEQLSQTHRIFLLQKKNGQYGALFTMLKELIDVKYCITYGKDDGAVAILRQMSTGIHLQANSQIYAKIKQYLNNIWMVGEDPEEQAIRQFKTEIEMLTFLSNMNKSDQS